MSASTSTKKSINFKNRKPSDKAPTLKLDNVTILTGQENYNIWAATMKHLLKTIKCAEIVINGIEPEEDASDEEQDAYESLCDHANTLFIQTVSKEILEKIVELEHPHEMWMYLRTQYYRDTAYALVSQIMNLVALPSTYDSSQPISSFVQRFETEWLHLVKMAKSFKDDYRKRFAEFFEEDKAKRDFLLGFLSRHQKNVVDNLSTKDDFTFAEVKQRLLDLDHEVLESSSSDQVALAAFEQKRKGKAPAKASNNFNSGTKTKECTWCKKHHPGRHQGHYWSECLKLKKHQEEKKGKAHSGREEAHVTTDSASKEVSTPFFYFDTAATSHMCPILDRFEHISLCTGSVRSSAGTTMPIKGKGTVVLDCVLSDGTVSSFRLRDVLYVPKVERPLLSWPKISGSHKMIAKGDLIKVFKDDKCVLEAAYDDKNLSLARINEVTEHSFLTFEFWHEALGHLAPSSMEKAKDLYADGTKLIPSAPPSFHCSSCSIAKSQHHKPQSSDNSRDRGFLIHSDLCGPFPVPSFGGYLYYISFVHDKSKVCWVRFLKHKSDASQAIQDFVNEIELQHSVKVQRFRTDNGGEYVNKALTDFFSSKGIVHELTPPYSPESNGVAERLNRTIGEALRAMLLPLEKELPNKQYARLWAEAVQTIVYVKNRQPHAAVKGQTPYEAFYGSKPTIHHLQPFGRECYIHIPKDKRPPGSKLSPRAQRGLFVGYTNVNHHYRVFIPQDKRTAVSGDVFFPPLKTEGAFPPSEISKQVFASLKNRPSTTSTNPQDTGSVNLSIPTTERSTSINAMWTDWMRNNVDTARREIERGRPDIIEAFYNIWSGGQRDDLEVIAQLAGYNDLQSADLDRWQTADRWISPDPQPAESESHTPPGSPRQVATQPQVVIHQPPAPAPSPPHEPEPQTDNTPPAPPQPLPAQPARQPVTTTRSGRVVRPPAEWWVAPTTNQSIAMPDASDDNNEQVEELSEEELATVEVALVSVLEIAEPATYRQAEKSAEWPQWRQAMEEEVKSLRENKVWDVVNRPRDRKVVDGKWVYKVKGNSLGEIERFKARYVAKGFSQIQGIDYDETYASVARYDSLRLLLAITACKNWRPRQLDIKTAFLYGILKEDIYMQLPEGYREDGKVARLKRCIYGLKQSPREWYFRLVEYLRPYGFAFSSFDPCVLVHESGNLFIAIYVDDITLFGEQGQLLNQTVSILKSEFKVNDMGLLHWLLGIQIEYSDAGISLSQTAFIDKILNRFSMRDCNPVATPIDANHRLMAAAPDDERADATCYQQIIGSLMYLVTATRPDLAYTITHLSQFNSDPSKAHMNAAKRVLRYLKRSRDQKLLFPFSTSDIVLSGFTDASYGNCLDTRRSFSGYIFQLNGCTISWRSRKQRTVATSTCEAEYMALAMATKHHLWLQRALKELLKRPITAALSVDSNSALDLANNAKINDRSKHIDIAYHFTREKVEDGSLNLLHVPSSENLADICTKGLPRPSHDHLCTLIFTGTK